MDHSLTLSQHTLNKLLVQMVYSASLTILACLELSNRPSVQLLDSMIGWEVGGVRPKIQ